METISIKETLGLCNNMADNKDVYLTPGYDDVITPVRAYKDADVITLIDAFRRLAGVVSEIEDCVSHARDCGAEGFRMKFAEWDSLMYRHGLEE